MHLSPSFITSLKMFVAITTVLMIRHLASGSRLPPALINTSSPARLKRDYGGYDGGYGYSSGGGGYSQGHSYSCCACESSSPLLFFGLGALLGLLLAMPMMMNTVPPVAINPIRTARSVEQLEEERKFGVDVLMTAFTKIKLRPDCANEWFCEIYKMSEDVLPRSTKWLLIYIRTFLVDKKTTEKSICGNLSRKSCQNLLPT